MLDFDIAQDITQDVFVMLYERKETLEIQTSIKGFLYTAVRNRCLDHLKSVKIHDRHHEEIQRSTQQMTSQEDDTIERIALQQKIHNEISKLPVRNQKIFKLSRLEGKTNQEIAEILQISKRTVETHISNALKKLRSVLTVLIFFIINTINL